MQLGALCLFTATTQIHKLCSLRAREPCCHKLEAAWMNNVFQWFWRRWGRRWVWVRVWVLGWMWVRMRMRVWCVVGCGCGVLVEVWVWMGAWTWVRFLGVAVGPSLLATLQEKSLEGCNNWKHLCVMGWGWWWGWGGGKTVSRLAIVFNSSGWVGWG